MPLLSSKLSFSDTSLILLGTGSLVLEYLFYGLTSGASTAFLVWLGPLAGLVSNASNIAFKSMATKLVTSQEKGKAARRFFFLTFLAIFLPPSRST